MALEDLLKKLVSAPSISGFEKNVRDVMIKEIKPYVDDIRVDRVGNLIARKGKGAPKVMIAAHMDELGLIVRHIDKKGFIQFDTVGGWDERILPATKVRVYGSKGALVGMVGTKPPHLQEKEEQKHPIKLKDMYIDIGAGSEKEAREAGVRVGDFITHYGEVSKMLKRRVTGYGFDNRLGCLALIEIVKKVKGFKGTLYAVGTVQEETGLIGVRGSAFGINPDVVVALDTTIAGDTPDIKPGEVPIKIGGGPVLVIKDASSIINPKVREWIDSTAKKIRMPLQYEVTSAGATDAAVMPITREGIPSGTVSIPTRYLHTPVEMADLSDLEKVVKLLSEAVGTASKYF